LQIGLVGGFHRLLLVLASSHGIARPINLKDAVPAKSLYEFVNVGAGDFDGCVVSPADFFSDTCFVPSLLYQLEDFRADNVKREHLTVTDIEKDSSIFGSCTSN
jgi:hypothetical protein